jgi:hypothetical protein
MSNSRPSEPIRREHAELLLHVEDLRRLGDAAVTPGVALEEELRRVLAFLQQHLLIHARAEDRVLYPRVAALLDSPRATATMSRDHVEVERLTSALRRAAVSDRETVARLAYGLFAIVTLHFAKEEEIYLDILDAALSADDVSVLYEQMEQEAASIQAAGTNAGSSTG